MATVFDALRHWLWPGGPSLDRLHDEGFVALDVETTGLDPRRDAILAVAAIPFVGGEPREGYVSLVDPRRPIPPASTAIHGISDADVAGAPDIDVALAGLDAVLGTRIVVGHALDFDLAIIARAARARGRHAPANVSLDTARLAAALHPDWPDHGLDAVAARFGVAIDGRHTARGDAVAAGRLLLTLLPLLRGKGIRRIGEARWLQRQAGRAPIRRM